MSLQEYLDGGTEVLKERGELPLPPRDGGAPDMDAEEPAAAGGSGCVGSDRAEYAGSVVGASASRTSRSSGAPHLHRSSEAAQLRAMRLQQELMLREMAECTFAPRTNGGGAGARVAPTSFFERAQAWKDKKDAEQAERRRTLDGERMQAR